MEVDESPRFEVLEIEGEAFPISEYHETVERDNKVGRHALLKRHGAAFFWSRHEEGDKIFYKQIVRFYPQDLEPGALSLASGVVQDNLANIVIEMATKFNELVKELRASGKLIEEVAAKLAMLPHKTTLDDRALSKWSWRFEQVRDASKDMQRYGDQNES
jgi:hypothetical protein